MMDDGPNDDDDDDDDDGRGDENGFVAVAVDGRRRTCT